jgi:hypothetical protein
MMERRKATLSRRSLTENIQWMTIVGRVSADVDAEFPQKTQLLARPYRFT